MANFIFLILIWKTSATLNFHQKSLFFSWNLFFHGNILWKYMSNSQFGSVCKKVFKNNCTKLKRLNNIILLWLNSFVRKTKYFSFISIYFPFGHLCIWICRKPHLSILAKYRPSRPIPLLGGVIEWDFYIDPLTEEIYNGGNKTTCY